MRSVMKHQFSQIPKVNIQRSSFDRSHGYKTTFDAGLLIPFFIDEVLPGDTFNLRASVLARLATSFKPIMDNMFLDSFFFFVPTRLVWANWKKFNGEQANPGDSTDYSIPQLVMPAGGAAIGSLSDYFGIPTGVAGLSVSALPYRCHNLIYNEWFRDQNMQNSVAINTTDGPDTYTTYGLYRRGKRHDYFTSCLPFPQKGPDVTLPLGQFAPVVTTNAAFNLSPSTGSGAVFTANTPNFMSNGAGGTNHLGVNVTVSSQGPAAFGNVSGLQADLTNASSATINAWLQAYQLQKFYELDARGGTRYIEIIKAHFGVTSPDARLQRPEYLGGGSSPVNFHLVAQTSEENETPQANLAAFAQTNFSGHGFSKSFTEHGYVIGYVSARADLTYQQGLNRMWSRKTRPEFYWPTFSHLGEQAVLNKEIYAVGSANPTQDAAVFGYQERYAEYRYKPSGITGIFRSSASDSLDNWHLSQNFGSLPTLNDTFISENPPVDRIIWDDTDPHFLFDSFISLNCARPMPVYSVPGIKDHF